MRKEIGLTAQTWHKTLFTTKNEQGSYGDPHSCNHGSAQQDQDAEKQSMTNFSRTIDCIAWTVIIFTFSFIGLVFALSFIDKLLTSAKIRLITNGTLFASEHPLVVYHKSGLLIVGRCDEIRAKNGVGYIINNKRRDIKTITNEDIAELSIYRHLAEKSLKLQISRTGLLRFINEDGTFKYTKIDPKEGAWAENLISRYIASRSKAITTQIASIKHCCVCRYALECYEIGYQRSGEVKI